MTVRGASLTSYVLCDWLSSGKDDEIWRSSGSATWTDWDGTRVNELRAWSARVFGNPTPFSSFRTTQYHLADLRGLSSEHAYDVLAQIRPLNSSAVGAASQRRTDLLLLCSLFSPGSQVYSSSQAAFLAAQASVPHACLQHKKRIGLPKTSQAPAC